jgi:hypothetical protein
MKLFGVLFLLLGVPTATGQTITEFPGAITPLRITAGPDGNVWFTEVDRGPGIGRITPEGVITEFTIPTRNAGPLEITTGPDGNLWFTEAHVNRIGRVTTSGSFTEFPLPTAASRAGSADEKPAGHRCGSNFSIWSRDGFSVSTNVFSCANSLSTGMVRMKNMLAPPGAHFGPKWYTAAYISFAFCSATPPARQAS